MKSRKARKNKKMKTVATKEVNEMENNKEVLDVGGGDDTVDKNAVAEKRELEDVDRVRREVQRVV